MPSFILEIEDALECYAKEISILDVLGSDSSTIRSVCHQWAFALANKSDLYKNNHGASKDKIRRILSSKGLYKNAVTFKKKLIASINIKPPSLSEFTFIDLFSGIGGIRQGFEATGGVCVFSSEIDTKARNTYFKNYSELPFGDITSIDPCDIPKHDILTAGFPCQPFSQAGKRLGLEDTRGTLFYNIASIAKAKKPKVIFLENVRGLISQNRGNTLRTILELLEDMGYVAAFNSDSDKSMFSKMLLSAKDFGLPQNRNRIYIILWRDNLKIKNFNYPRGSKTTCRLGDFLEKNVDPKYTISDRLWDGHKRRKVDNKNKGKGFGYSLFDENSPYVNTITKRYYKDGVEALIAQKNKNPRKLTPREAARVQGFPEDFILDDSNVEAYKQFGNAVAVPVVQKLAEAIKVQIIKK